MKTIFTMDQKDYTEDMPVLELTTVRAIIEEDGRFAMQKSGAGYYKIPGGGVDGDEDLIDALARECMEEVGIDIDLDTVEEIGQTFEIRRDVLNPLIVFKRRTVFYKVQAAEKNLDTSMTHSEIALGFEPDWPTMDEFLEANKVLEDEYWQMRDTLFMRWYKDEKAERGEI